MSMEELKYFFSYSRKDSEFVLQLAKDLRAAGANVWLDQLDILGGEHWDDTIEKTLKSCKGVIAVLSPESVASSNVMDEVSYALDKGKLVVPVIIRSCEIPLRLRRLQHIDFAADYDTGFSQLLRALGIEQPVQPPESAATPEPVVQDSTAPVEAKPTEHLVHEKQASQEVEEPSPPEVSETAPGTPHESKSTGVETEKVPSMSQKTKMIAVICIVALIFIVSIVVLLIKLQPKTYILIPTAGPNGSISPSEETTVTSGGDLTFKAILNKGYQVDTWSVDGITVQEGGTYFKLSNIHADQTVKVTFRPLELVVASYAIKASARGGGTIIPSGEVTVNSGVNQSFTIKPDAGYQIADVVVDGASIGAVASHTFTKVTANHTIDASFTVAVPPVAAYTITALADGGGEISPSGKVTVKSGVDQSFTIKPKAGYQIADVVVDGNSVGAVASYTFTNVTADHTIAASFAVAAYTITASADGGGAISPSGEVLVNSGDDKSFSIKPKADYKIADVVVDGNSVGAVASYTFTNVTADHTIAAGFTLKAPVVKTNSIGMKLVYIPAGEFMMGSGHSPAQLAKEYETDMGRFMDEFPQHKVHISEGFWMGQTEVTQKQYREIMTEEPWSGKPYVQESANNPAVYVTWNEAAEFCNKLSQQEGKTYRLPTEAEWEYACRAGTTTQFSFGDSDSSLGSHAWFWKNTYEECQDCAAHLVGQKKSNPWVLYDMHGNVREWCSDWYAEDYYSNSPSVDPNGPSTGATRSLRGGSWANTEACLRCSCRDGYAPDVGRSSVGFRVVREQ